MNRRDYYVYLLASPSHRLYVGVTNNLERRIYEHKAKLHPGFTRAYNIAMLVHLESFGDIRDAIAREKEIKHWRREKKIALIETENPHWLDLSQGWNDQ